GDERPVVADHHALADQRMRPQPVFEHGRGDILAAGRDDQFLLPARDAQEAFVVERADVTGVQPAVGVEHLGGRIRVAPVTAEYPGSGPQDLAVLSDPEARAWNGQANCSYFVTTRQVHYRGRRRLGEAIALKHGDAGAAEEVTEPFAERRAAG